MAAGVTGIPCALVVDRHGIVRCCGHPADPAFEAAIRQVSPMHAGVMEGLCTRECGMHCHIFRMYAQTQACRSVIIFPS